MDATIVAVIGTGLAGIGTATGLFVALWRVQQTGFDALNRQMQNQFEGLEKRLEMAEKHNRERFEMAEKHNDAAHAAICERIDKLDQRTHADAVALNNRLDALHGRFDNLYRHLAGPPPDAGPAGGAPAG
jgi:hypothetical protein